MFILDKKDVLHLAETSKISLSDEEILIFETEMNEFLKMIEFEEEKIFFGTENNIDFSDLREDEVIKSQPREEILKNASKTKENGFLVPKIF